MDFPVYNRDIDRILRTEGTKAGARIGDITNATPSTGTILMSTTLVSGGTFTKWVKRFWICSNVDCEILLNVRLANGFVNESNLDLKGVINENIQLQANIRVYIDFDDKLYYNQVVQFIFQKYRNGASGSLNLTSGWTGYELFMNRNDYAPLSIKILGDSISAGANSSTTNEKPYGSWFSQVVYDLYGATQDVKGVQKGVGGVTASGMNQASITGFSRCDQASLIFIALGTNPDSTLTVFGDSISAIIQRERAYHPDAWIALCNPIMKDNSGEALMVDYRGVLQNIYTNLADPKMIHIHFEDLEILPGVTPGDVHPIQSGHNIMYGKARTDLLANNVTI